MKPTIIYRGLSMGICSDCYYIKLCVVRDMTWKVIANRITVALWKERQQTPCGGRCEGR